MKKATNPNGKAPQPANGHELDEIFTPETAQVWAMVVNELRRMLANPAG